MNTLRPATLVLCGLLSLTTLGRAQWYTITDLGSLGGPWAWAYSINDSGQVVGRSLLTDPAAGGHSFLYSDRTLTDLAPFEVGFSWSSKYLNNLGLIGGVTRIDTVLRPALYDAGQITVLPSLGLGCGGFCAGEVTAVNSFGLAAGWSSISDELYHAVLWGNGTLLDLGSFGAWSYASSLNDAGMVVGLSAYERSQPDEDWVQHPFLYANGVMTDLTQFGLVVAVDINNQGQVVGSVEAPEGRRHAAVLAGGVTTDLHSLGVESDAAAISESGKVVGSFMFASGTGQYFDPFSNEWKEYVIYSWHAYAHEHGVMRDLNRLIFPSSRWDLQYATDVNTAGQIVGWGLYQGEFRGFLLTPATKIRIDIKPKDFPNAVQPGSNGLIPVAILSSSALDARMVNPKSVLFGLNGDEVASCLTTKEDLNKDRRLDLLFHFRTDQTGLRLGDTAAILTAKLWDGSAVTGQDSIRTIPPR